MHGDVQLGGPVWLFAQLVVLLAIVLNLFVLVDSLRPKRRADAAARLPEPLWVYAAFSAIFLGLSLVVTVIPGLQVTAAAVPLATPLALVVGVAYLLRVVFPKPAPDGADGDQAVDDTVPHDEDEVL